MNPYTADDFERENADILDRLSPMTRALVATGQSSFTRDGRTVRVGSHTRAAPPMLTRTAEDKARDLLARIEARSIKAPNPAPKHDDDAAAFEAFRRSPAAPAPSGGDVAPPPMAPPPVDDDSAAFAAFMRQVGK